MKLIEASGIATDCGQKTDGGDGAEQVELVDAAPADSAPTNVPGQVIPLTETTNEALTATKGAEKKPAPRERKQRGPPEDGVPSKTKVMVANLPYDLKEDKVCVIQFARNEKR